MRKLLCAFLMVAVVFCFPGCSKTNDDSKEQNADSKTDYVVENITDDEILYYMAFNAEEASVAEQVKNAYLFRYNSGEIKDCIGLYVNPEVLMQPVETDHSIDDSKWDTINENGVLRIGMIKNGKFAFEERSEDGTNKTAGCFDSIARLICMRVKLTSDISIYNSKEDAISALHDDQIDIIIGIDDNTDQELIYSFPIIRDRVVACKMNNAGEETTRYITTEQYRDATSGLEYVTDYRDNLDECFDLMRNDKNVNYAVICMLSDLPVTDPQQLPE